MPKGIASANQLSMMEKVLDAYCRTYDVSNSAERDELASHILELFDRGFRDVDVLLAELIARRN